jgi:hypothetical protein
MRQKHRTTPRSTQTHSVEAQRVHHGYTPSQPQFEHAFDRISVFDSSQNARGLEADVRDRMERAFGADFESVRISEGSVAELFGALAVTNGEHLHFRPGLYQPYTAEGAGLLAHELTHVTQQRSGMVAGMGLVNDATLEKQADDAARDIDNGLALQTSTTRSSRLAPSKAIQATKRHFVPDQNKQGWRPKEYDKQDLSLFKDAHQQLQNGQANEVELMMLNQFKTFLEIQDNSNNNSTSSTNTTTSTSSSNTGLSVRADPKALSAWFSSRKPPIDEKSMKDFLNGYKFQENKVSRDHKASISDVINLLDNYAHALQKDKITNLSQRAKISNNFRELLERLTDENDTLKNSSKEGLWYLEQVSNATTDEDEQKALYEIIIKSLATIVDSSPTNLRFGNAGLNSGIGERFDPNVIENHTNSSSNSISSAPTSSSSASSTSASVITPRRRLSIRSENIGEALAKLGEAYKEVGLSPPSDVFRSDKKKHSSNFFSSSLDKKSDIKPMITAEEMSANNNNLIERFREFGKFPSGAVKTTLPQNNNTSTSLITPSGQRPVKGASNFKDYFNKLSKEVEPKIKSENLWKKFEDKKLTYSSSNTIPASSVSLAINSTMSSTPSASTLQSSPSSIALANTKNAISPLPNSSPLIFNPSINSFGSTAILSTTSNSNLASTSNIASMNASITTANLPNITPNTTLQANHSSPLNTLTSNYLSPSTSLSNQVLPLSSSFINNSPLLTSMPISLNSNYRQKRKDLDEENDEEVQSKHKKDT